MASTSSTCTPSPDERERALRFSVVGFVHAMEARGMSRADAVAEAARYPYLLLDGTQRLVSTRSVYRYLRAFADDPATGLASRPRQRIATSTVLDPVFLDWLARAMTEDPAASIPEMIRRAVECGVLPAVEAVDRSTVYRAARRMGLPVGRGRRAAPEADQRRYAYPHRMQMVLCDGKHFRVGPTAQRRVALVFLDDATRMALHAVVGTDGESAALFLRGLYELTRKVGLADTYYLDHGSGFRALDTVEVITARLGRRLVHGRVRYPEGRGKIERFNRTLQADVLRGWRGATRIETAPEALARRLRHYLDRQYNVRPHRALGGRPPAEAFDADERELALPEERADRLAERFVTYIERVVTRDQTVSIDNVAYELPSGLAGRKVRLHRRVLDESLWLPRDGEAPLRLHPVDPVHNARSARKHRRARGAPPGACVTPSAADLAFDRDHAPVVDADGGCDDDAGSDADTDDHTPFPEH